MKLDEEIYRMISQRVKYRKKAKKMQNIDILLSDSNVVSNIVNNKRYKKNPYLLTPTYAFEIVKNLRFTDSYTLIWGNKIERESYFGMLFFEGMNYLLKKETELIEKSLSYYVPYAYDLAIREWKNKYGDGISLLFPNLKIDKDNENSLLAMQLLYNHYKEEFFERHANYFNDLYTTKLDKKITNFFETELLDMVSNGTLFNRGREFFNLILQNLSLTAEMTIDSLPGVDSKFHPQLDFSKSVDTFIKSIIHYQEQLEGEIVLTDSLNRWTVDLMNIK
jgi:hypothetical protein